MRDLAVRVEQFPKEPEMHATYAVLLEAHGRLPEAVAEQRRAVALAADKPEYQRGLARLLVASGDLPGALAALVAAQALDGSPGDRREVEQRLALERQPTPVAPDAGARRAAFELVRGGGGEGLAPLLERARAGGGELVGWSLDDEIVDGDDVLVGVHFLFRRVYNQAQLERDALLVGRPESELGPLTGLVLRPLARGERERVLAGRLGQTQATLLHATLRYRRADQRLVAVNGAEGEVWRAPVPRAAPPARSTTRATAIFLAGLVLAGLAFAVVFRLFDRLAPEL